MKKVLFILMIMSLLMSGCNHGNPDQPTETTSEQAESNETQSTSAESETPELTLMDSSRPVGELGNTWYIPNAALEDMVDSELCLFGDTLLVYANVLDEGKGNHFLMKRISLSDGSLMAENYIECGSFITLQLGDGSIGICDSEKGVVRIFDDKLTETASYTVDKSGDNWYLSRDMQLLYIVDWQNGITSVNLVDGTEKEILSDAADIYVRNYTQDYVSFSYTDMVTQRICSQLLNLESGRLESLPVNGDVITAVCVDNIWLIGDSANWGEYKLVSNGTIQNAVWKENRIELLAPKAHILTVDLSGSILCLYDAEGGFISKCILPGDGVWAGRNLVWSNLWNGYFFLSFENSACGKLMFWDVEIPVSGEDFYLEAEGTKGGNSADPVLYEKARDLGDKYGVEICIADQCQLDYGYFDSYEIADSQGIEDALEILDRTFASYPEGFLKQLTYGNIQKLQIELVGGLVPKPGTAVGDTTAAFAQEKIDYYLIVFDMFSLTEGNIYHEITHVLDRRLEWDASLREDCLFSEEAWMELNPEGFQYADSYGELPASVTQYGNTGCFASDYSMTFPTEDRATMMEAAMTGEYIRQEYWSGLLRKLDYYSRCIRDCFDTAGWPETTAWEAVLY